MCKGRDFAPEDAPGGIAGLWGEMAAAGEPGVLATVVAVQGTGPSLVGSKLILHGDGRMSGTVGGGAVEARVVAAAGELLAQGGTRLLRVEQEPGPDACGGQVDVFLESLRAGFPFWILGAGHVGRALVEMGRHLPLRFILVDERPELLEALGSGFGARTMNVPVAELAQRLEVVPASAVLIAGPSHDLDFKYLQAVLEAEERTGVRFEYLGLLGSARKVAQLRKRLEGREQRLARLEKAQMPVGLDVGEGSPAGIALAVLAEAMAVLNGRPYLCDPEGEPLGLRLHRRREGTSANLKG